jgi:hypothetical protein
MPDRLLSRRVALAPLGALILAAALTSQDAFARRLVQAGGIRVDVTPLRGNTGDPTAAWVERELPGALAQAMGGRAPRGPAIVRIDHLTLGPNTGATIHGGSSPDNIEGVLIQGGSQTPIRATTSYMSSPIDQTMIEQANHDRVSALAQALAYWVAPQL